VSFEFFPQAPARDPRSRGRRFLDGAERELASVRRGEPAGWISENFITHETELLSPMRRLTSPTRSSGS